MKVNCGENIKRYRQLNGLSQAELGEKLGVKHGAISSWEKNRTEPKIGQIEKMCIIFGCKKSDIVPNVNKDIAPVPSGIGEVIDLYSKSTPEQQQAVVNLLRSFVRP